MHARVGRLILLSALLALLLPLGCSSEPAGGGGECVISGGNEQNPGYPFSLTKYEQEALPALKTNCASCHDPNGVGVAGFQTWAAAATPGTCAFVDTFESVKAASDTTRPDQSKIIVARTSADHTAVPGEAFDTLLSYIQDANTTCVADGGCVDNGGALTSFFNEETFATVIQPALDATGCAVAGCHLAPDGQFGFSLNPAPAEGSPELEANFDMVTQAKYANLDGQPNAALAYIQATTPHNSGTTPTIDAAAADAMLQWITDAKTLYEEQGQPTQVNCSDPTLLNPLAWENEIYPMLQGEVDYNDQNNDNILTGCTRGPCHGQPRPGSFDLVGTPEEALEKFACFIDLTSPSNSQVLQCPADSALCRVDHPGGELFVDADDINYQKLLSFLFAAVQDRSPVDFPQFARTINPLFDDEAACDDELDNVTCANTGACHGCNVAGCVPPNNSDFGLLPNAGTSVNTLRTNYAAAHNFISFGVPESSSLFLYPTNTIADRDDPVFGDFATGIQHGAGQCFAQDSAQAAAVLAWAEGLRPDDDGFLTNFLVTGAFATVDPDDERLFNEDTIRPQIFDQSNGEDLEEWDFFTSPQQLVDLGAFLDALGGDVGQGRTAYAAAYLINTTPVELQVQLNIVTDNEIELYFGNNQASSPAGGGNVSATITIPAYDATAEIPRILMRVHQAADDAAMAFTVQIVDADNNVPFNGADDDIIELTGQGGV